MPKKALVAKKAVAPKKASVAKASVAKASVAKAVTPKVTKAKKAALAGLQPRDSADVVLDLILKRLDDMKAEETVTIDLRGKSAFSDYMVITTGRSNRHVGSLAENVAKGLKESGNKKLHIEGLPNCDWVLIDSGEVIVHVFRPEVREFYNLERLWTQRPGDDKIELKAV